MSESIFTNRRMYRLFRENGRSVVVAMDHGLGSNVYPGLADPSHVIDAVVAGGADSASARTVQLAGCERAGL